VRAPTPPRGNEEKWEVRRRKGEFEAKSEKREARSGPGPGGPSALCPPCPPLKRQAGLSSGGQLGAAGDGEQATPALCSLTALSGLGDPVSGHLSTTRPRSTCDPLSWSRGAPVHPHGCMDQAGSQKSGRIPDSKRVGSDSRSSWERNGLLVPWTTTTGRALFTLNRDLHAGNALVHPYPRLPLKVGKTPSIETSLVAVRAGTVLENQRFPTKTPIKFRRVRVQRQVTTRRRGEWCILVDTDLFIDLVNLDRRAIGATVASRGRRPSPRAENSPGVAAWGTRHSAATFGVFVLCGEAGAPFK
jgi:hypothetical protein